MKRLLIALLATSGIALAAPALAHPEDDHPAVATDQSWNNGGDTYAEFDQEYQHIWDGIQHGLSDGSYTQRQAQQYFRAMQEIRARAEAMEQAGRYDPRDTQARLTQLHAVMHQDHEDGHAMQERRGGADGWNNGGDTYAEFDQEYRQIWQNIQHSLNDGAYTRSQAQSFYRAMQQIRAQANWMQRSGRYNPQVIQARLERLDVAMDAAHERGHDQQDRYGDYRR